MGLPYNEPTISFWEVATERILVTRDMVDSGNSCSKRKKRIAPNIRSRPTVFTLGIFFSANHIIVALTADNVTAPSPPPTQYRYEGVSVDIWTQSRKKKENTSAEIGCALGYL